jgi:D-sedoheptulose 7-phosphate isomerase
VDRKVFIANELKQSSEVKLQIIDECTESIVSAADLLIEAVTGDKKILFCGNGGSAADSQHLATEFMIRLSHDIKRPAIPALALTTDSSNLTAGGNDIGFENIFARNVQGLGNTGDVLIAISTSGNSGNIIKAVEMAKSKEMKVIGLLGGSGGQLASMVNVPIIIPSSNVQRIQEGHITVGHMLCEIVEREIYG